MNVNIHDLPQEVVASYEGAARAHGITLDAYLREYLIRNAPSSSPAPMSADDWERALDECFDSFPAAEPLPDHAFSRESIYGREDTWLGWIGSSIPTSSSELLTKLTQARCSLEER